MTCMLDEASKFPEPPNIATTRSDDFAVGAVIVRVALPLASVFTTEVMVIFVAFSRLEIT